MTSTETTAATAAATEPDEPAGWNWVDTCGLIAGAILVVICLDIFTDGRLISRRLRGQPPQEEVPDAGVAE
jgi:hypothetical protein